MKQFFETIQVQLLLVYSAVKIHIDLPCRQPLFTSLPGRKSTLPSLLLHGADLLRSQNKSSEGLYNITTISYPETYLFFSYHCRRQSLLTKHTYQQQQRKFLNVGNR